MKLYTLLLALVASSYAEANIIAASPESQVASTITIDAAGSASTSVAAVAGVSSAAAAAAAPSSAQGQQAAQAPQAASNAQVVAGQGLTGNGDACGCDCLCGAAVALPADVGVGNFGGFVGMLPSPAASV